MHNQFLNDRWRKDERTALRSRKSNWDQFKAENSTNHETENLPHFPMRPELEKKIRDSQMADIIMVLPGI